MPTPAPAPSAIEERLQRQADIIKLWDIMMQGVRQAVADSDFVTVHNAPQLVGVTGACENVDTLFKVDFYGRQGYLAQSDQLYLELLTPFLGRVYTEIQSFRAEPTADDRHLAQFTLAEVEMLGDLKDLQKVLDDILYTAIENVLMYGTDTLLRLGVDQSHISQLNDWSNTEVTPCLTYSDAIVELRGTFPELAWGDDLTQVHEAALVRWSHGPVFITHYPKAIKFFNMKVNELHADVVNSCDLLLPFAGESAGAAEREHVYARLHRRLVTSDMYHRLIELGGQESDFDWYLDAHRDREIPLHSGAGIGMARVAQFILGCDDIRDAVPFLVNRENLL